MVQQLTRRAFLPEPGESLLLPGSSIDVVLRYGQWQRFTGLPDEALLSGPMLAVPLVRHPAEGHLARVLPGINPASLWHPLMWLPSRLAHRYELVDPDTGERSLEDDELWAVRVTLELSMSGLYDVETGTWLDVLAMHGLNVDDPATLDRIAAWQAGAADPILDVIDLTELVDLDDQHWALDSAAGLLPDLRAASWALIANDLVAALDDLAAPDSPAFESGNPAAVHSAALTVANLGGSLLAHPDAGLGPAYWESQQLALAVLDATDSDGVLDGPVADMAEALYQVRDRHWSHVDALAEADGEAEPQPV